MKGWEKDYNLNLETDYFKQLVQLDVNNYIGVTDEGKYKCKGKFKKFVNEDIFGNNQCRIIDVMLGEYLLNGTPLIKTAMKHQDDLKMFQILVKRSNKFDAIMINDEKLEQKVNRGFAILSDEELKCRKVKGEAYSVAVPFDPNIKIYNNDINGLTPTDIGIKLDLGYYVRRAKSILKEK